MSVEFWLFICQLHELLQKCPQMYKSTYSVSPQLYSQVTTCVAALRWQQHAKDLIFHSPIYWICIEHFHTSVTIMQQSHFVFCYEYANLWNALFSDPETKINTLYKEEHEAVSHIRNTLNRHTASRTGLFQNAYGSLLCFNWKILACQLISNAFLVRPFFTYSELLLTLY